jgi:hypothetical protein
MKPAELFPWTGRALVLLLLVLHALAAPSAAAEPDYAAIDRFVEAERRAQGIPGIAAHSV